LFEGRDIIVRLLPDDRPDDHVWIASETDLDYITVGIGPGHAHFSDWNNDRSISSIADEAMACVEDVLKGRLVGVQFLDGSGGLFDPGSLSDKQVQLLVNWKQA
jgi:hypothetical protein